MFEASIKRDLIPQKDVVCEIDLTEFLKGDALQVAQENAILVQNGIKAENQARRDYGWNPIPGLDEPRRSANQDRGGDPRQPSEKNPGDRETMEGEEKVVMAEALAPVLPFVPQSALGGPSASPPQVGPILTGVPTGAEEPGRGTSGPSLFPEDSGRSVALPAGDRDGKGETVSAEPTPPTSLSNHHLRITISSASRLFRRECEAIKKAAIRHAANPQAWSLWTAEFYSAHSKIVAEGLAVELAQAEAYTLSHFRQVRQRGLEAVAEWERMSETADGERMCEGVREMVELATQQQGG
jgi:hypothetical protein